ncbi:MAG: hypothetical protein CMJ31_11515 [Phycisphaerae bacterium]|nr:hypothetical protein [Phycisphaerae bacterium]
MSDRPDTHRDADPTTPPPSGSTRSDAQSRGKPGEPFCGRCGYPLGGLVDSSKCPECGGALVEVLRWPGQVMLGRRWRTQTLIFGIPVIDIAFGPAGTDRVGRARGFIAVGDEAMGVLAIGGGFARGIVAIGGGGSLGVFTIGGGMTFGVLSAIGGGMSAGLGVTFGGGLSAGTFAGAGGAAAGFIASAGGLAAGYYARAGGFAAGVHTLSSAGRPQSAVDAWAGIEPIVGQQPGFSLGLGMFTDRSLGLSLALLVLATLIIGMMAAWKLRAKPDRLPRSPN